MRRMFISPMDFVREEVCVVLSSIASKASWQIPLLFENKLVDRLVDLVKEDTSETVRKLAVKSLKALL